MCLTLIPQVLCHQDLSPSQCQRVLTSVNKEICTLLIDPDKGKNSNGCSDWLVVCSMIGGAKSNGTRSSADFVKPHSKGTVPCFLAFCTKKSLSL